jgi:hypothetical protein
MEAAVSLEVRGKLLPIPRVLLEVGTVPIALPDLDDGIAERFPPGVEEPATEVRDLADGGVIVSLMMSRSLSVSSGSLFGKNGPSFVVGVRVNSSVKAPRAVRAVAPRASVPRNTRRLVWLCVVFMRFSYELDISIPVQHGPVRDCVRHVVLERVASGPLARAARNPKIPFIVEQGAANEIRFIWRTRLPPISGP